MFLRNINAHTLFIYSLHFGQSKYRTTLVRFQVKQKQKKICPVLNSTEQRFTDKKGFVCFIFRTVLERSMVRYDCFDRRDESKCEANRKTKNMHNKI